jgi:hypothetical protein
VEVLIIRRSCGRTGRAASRGTGAPSVASASPPPRNYSQRSTRAWSWASVWGLGDSVAQGTDVGANLLGRVEPAISETSQDVQAVMTQRVASVGSA